MVRSVLRIWKLCERRPPRLSLPVLPEYTLHAESYTLILLSFSAKAEDEVENIGFEAIRYSCFWHLSTRGSGEMLQGVVLQPGDSELL